MPRARALSGGHPDEARFAALVQSPLRAALLRHLHAHPDHAFDAGELMQTFGSLRLDVENCLRELVSSGLSERHEGRPPTYRYRPPDDTDMRERVGRFAARPSPVSREDLSDAARRFRDTIGRDEKMFVVLEGIRTAAKADISVLILGPTGSGKELAANMIHDLSPRRDGPFQVVNCAALPDALFESEMFGHEKGSFTGADARTRGKLELADRGTLLLDEVANLSLRYQAKLLRALEHRRFERVGGQKPVASDFRLISTTNLAIEQQVADAHFREDLYYRINAFSIRLPSLRERAADIPVLARRMLAARLVAANLPPGTRYFNDEALAALAAHPWPGNLRELRGVVERVALSARAARISAADLAFLRHTAPDTTERPPTLAEIERRHILAVLESTGWNKQRTAELLGVGRGTLYRKIREYALDHGRAEL